VIAGGGVDKQNHGVGVRHRHFVYTSAHEHVEFACGAVYCKSVFRHNPRARGKRFAMKFPAHIQYTIKLEENQSFVRVMIDKKTQ